MFFYQFNVVSICTGRLKQCAGRFSSRFPVWNFHAGENLLKMKMIEFLKLIRGKVHNLLTSLYFN